MERIIRLAQEGGYDWRARALASYDDGGSAEEYLNSVIK